MATVENALATLDELRVRLEFELDDEHMVKMAEAALADASTLVREYGITAWSKDTAPPIAVTLTLKAAARFMNNPMLLETARGGDETNMWGSGNADGVRLTPEEIDLLRSHRKESRGFQSVPTYLYSPRPERRHPGHYFPVDAYGEKDPLSVKRFPDYRPGDEYDPYYPIDYVRGRR